MWRHRVTLAASSVELTAVSLLLTGLFLPAAVLAVTGIVISLALDGPFMRLRHGRRRPR